MFDRQSLRRSFGPVARRAKKLHPEAVPSVWRAGRPRRRLLAFLGALVVIFALILTRVALLQTTSATSYVTYGAKQRTRTIEFPAARGEVFFRDATAAALSLPSATIFANPQKVVDAPGTAHKLAAILGYGPQAEQLLAKDLAGDRGFIYIARQVDDDRAAAIKQLELTGVGWYDEQRRETPAGDIGKEVIGRVNVDGIGSSGLELQYDQQLHGVPGKGSLQSDGGQGTAIAGSRTVEKQPVSGDDLVLTLDRALQYEAEQALTAEVSEIGARGGTAIIMDSHSGEVFAMASVRRNGDTNGVDVTSSNIAAVDSYEPGSVAKVMTVSAAINQGAVTPDTTFEVPGQKLFYPPVPIKDAEPHPVQTMTVARILAKSSNIGTIMISQRMATADETSSVVQERYMRAFGIGSPSDLNFHDEASGILAPNSEWHGNQRVTIPYGQGFAVTAVQLIGAVNVIANNGTYVAPKLVRSVIDSNGVESATPASATRQVVTPQTAETMNMMMRDVVCDGTASASKVAGYTIAGKTGTGYKAQPNGTYLDADGLHHYMASFVGFFPAEAPRFTILVTIDDPPAAGSHFGGSVASPVFASLAKTVIDQEQIAPPTANGGCPKK
jgi:cell division protein FtsI (penicillin-binding protein 3)